MLMVVSKLSLGMPVHERNVHVGNHEGIILGAQHKTEKVVIPTRVGYLGMSEKLMWP